MPYDPSLAGCVRDLLARVPHLEEKRMFGGVCFLLNGNLLVGVWKDCLIARVGPEQYEESLQQPHVRLFDVTGRAMKGWVMVGPEGVETDEQVRTWIDRAAQFVQTLPPKSR